MENSNPMFSAAASSSSSPQEEYYDLFLSFRGEDTRNNFTGYLRDALRQKGFHTFFDDDKLERGKEINPELLKAIENSHCSVVVLSENYASSSWCLTELARIVERKGTSSGNILPIFYHVDPGNVRNQTGSYGEAFKKHEQDAKHNSQMVQSWRDALTNVGNLAGWHVTKDKPEPEFIKEFIVQLSTKLDVPTLNIKVLFGMDSRLKKFTSCFVSPSSDGSRVQFIGICGMGGIGKTTLAKAYYNQNFDKFDGSSFLANVRDVCKNENGLVYLQTQLLSNILKDRDIEIENVDRGIAMIKRRLQYKKILVVLDDVTQADQLEALVDHKNDWFGSGSIVIVTSRDKSLLTSNGISTIHETEILNSTEALQLFSWKAFKTINPPENYKELCKQVMEYAKDLPLAVAVLGSFLRGKSANEWESALNRLRKYQKKEIAEVLKVSFDDLEEIDQHIFLDIACFFNEYDKDNIIQVLDSCGFDSKYGISNLIGKSLLSIRHNELHMHDLLQDMGKKIVQKESPNEPGGQSRIWDVDDFFHILENGTGTNKIEAIVTTREGSRKLSSFKAMSDMKNLRLLMILDPYNFSCENDSLIPDFEYLSNGQLRLLQWDRFPYKCFPSSFRPYRLVQLKLVCSRIEELWNNHTKPLHNLKIIDLSYSEYFSKFEDFTVVPNLERLILEGCKVLSEIDDSITSLEKLISLNLASCNSLTKLPKSVKGMKSLQILNLNSCFALGELPEDCGGLKSLKEVDLRGSGISHLPSSIFLIENLKVFHDVDVVYSSSKRFNVPSNYADHNQDYLEISLDIKDDDTAVYKVQAAGEALQEDSELALLAKRTLEGYNSSHLIGQVSQQLKHFRTSDPKRTSTSTWPSVERHFDELTRYSDGLLPSSLFGKCIGMNTEFASGLFAALARRRNISGDSINKAQLRDFWEQLSDESFDSKLQTFFDILRVDKDAAGRITEEDVRKIISLSASANKLAIIKERAEEYAALIMKELDPDNVGYITIDLLETLLLQQAPNLSYSQIPSQILSQKLKPTQENTPLKRWYDKSKYFLMDNWPSTKAPLESLINRAFGSSMPVKILKIAIYPGNGMALLISKPQGFKYEIGQYMYVNCAAVSQFGWHPFYFSSSPGDDYLGIHFQILSKWEQQLKRMFSESCSSCRICIKVCQPSLRNVQGGDNHPRFPNILIDGPYGAPAQGYKKYEVVLLVGLGIGAAPMVSITKDILNNVILKSEEDLEEALWLQGGGGLETSTCRKAKSSNKGTGFRTRKAYLYWVTREQDSFDWFRGIINEVAELDREGVIEIHNYCTSVFEEGDARSALIAMLQSLRHAKNGVDVVFGRPHWRQAYERIAIRHPNSRVGVFCCGVHAFTEELRKLASDFSHETSTKFEFHKQNF